MWETRLELSQPPTRNSKCIKLATLNEEEELQVPCPGMLPCPASAASFIPCNGFTCSGCSNTMLDHLDSIVSDGWLLKVHRDFIGKYGGFVQAIVEILSSVSEVEVIGLVMEVLDLIMLEDSGMKQQLHDLISRNKRDCLSPFVLLLEKGSLKAKIRSAKVLESIASMSSQTTMFENQALLTGLHKLVSLESDQTARAAGLSSLIAVSQSRNVRSKLVRLGIVHTGGKILSNPETEVVVMEKVMKVLEIMSMCPEGRTAVCLDERCLKAIIARLMNVSVTATEHGIGVLWSVCYLSGDRMAKQAVAKCNGDRKVVLVMQSKCSGSVRLMCGDLVKLFQANSKPWLKSYETRTTRVA